VSGPLTGAWVEGPPVAQIGSEWWIYFDHYARPQLYWAVRTTDCKSFEDVGSQAIFPADHRHGTVVRLPEALARQVARGQ